MTVKAWQANRPRLSAMAQFLAEAGLQPGQINLGTFLARHRHDAARAQVGCVLGHYASTGTSRVISLDPVVYPEQLKSPVMATELLQEFPSKDWQHFTLHYHTPSCEAWGETAAMLYLQMGRWDLHRLFYPAGSSYEIRPPLESVLFRLRNMLETTP